MSVGVRGSRVRRWLSASSLVMVAVACGSETVGPAADRETGPGTERGQSATTGAPPTYCADVAPILFRHCVGCHRPGQSAPFALRTYRDAFRKQRQILRVTKSRRMPPWLPAPGDHPLQGARRLEAGEVETLARWVAEGAVEGNPDDLPALPEFAGGWQLREPDLVLVPDAPFPVPAAGPDLFYNFVIPVPGTQVRYVAAVEIRPGNPAVHHGILQADDTRQTRDLARRTPGSGFPGMDLGYSKPPDGHFLGWTPGKSVDPLPADMAWRLLPGSDLVLQLHLTPTGKPEQVRPRIGLFFTDRPPERFPLALTLYSETIDIPAGEGRYRVRDHFRLPVPVQLLGVYPHAHDLCREMRGTVTRPGASTETILHIPAWDFDWQDDYRFVRPLKLPAGTVLGMDYVYDNSAANPRNPHRPPRRVRFGPAATDEMGTLTLMVLPQRPEDRLVLEEHTWRRRLEKVPDDADAMRRLAVSLREQQRFRDAGRILQRVLQANPRDVVALCELSTCLLGAGQAGAALRCADQALALAPHAYLVRLGRGRALAAAGRGAEAETELRASLRLFPELVDAQVLLGNLLARRGETAAAIALFEQALAIRPATAEVHNNLATALFSQGALDRAAAAYRRALALRPDYFNARFNLGRVLAAQGDRAAARVELRRAAGLRPDHPGPAASLRALDQ